MGKLFNDMTSYDHIEELKSDMSLLQYELYIARQTINDLRSVVPDTVEADRLFSADSIDYLRSIGCAINNMKEINYV